MTKRNDVTLFEIRERNDKDKEKWYTKMFLWIAGHKKGITSQVFHVACVSSETFCWLQIYDFFYIFALILSNHPRQVRTQ